jgi:hypothetical protein
VTFDDRPVFVELHSSWEADRPREAEMERDLERHRQAVHEIRTGSMEGYEPRRTFPCPGAIRCLDVDGNGIECLRCDQCGYETTRRQNPRHLSAVREEEW